MFAHGSQVLEEVEVDDGVVLDVVVCVDELLALDVDVDVEVEAVVLVDVLVVVTELTLVVLEVDDEPVCWARCLNCSICSALCA